MTPRVFFPLFKNRYTQIPAKTIVATISIGSTGMERISVLIFLMPLAFAGSLGGMLTLIGTPPNLVIDEVLTEGGYQPLAFFSFFPVGIITHKANPPQE